MKLSTWVAESGGRRAVARKLRVTEQALYHWAKRKATPRIETIREIVKLSGGRVSIAEIIEETAPAPSAMRGRK